MTGVEDPTSAKVYSTLEANREAQYVLDYDEHTDTFMNSRFPHPFVRVTC
ncbi:MAG: hypothetical protein QCH35_04810 [Methanomicrobiaceae archaeon]|nr:hypothetical protein [Methanomicrobiaceae archaeon]